MTRFTKATTQLLPIAIATVVMEPALAQGEPYGPANIVSSSEQGAYDVKAADIDLDGDLDIVSAGDQAIAWYRNDGHSTFTRMPEVMASANFARSVFTVDVDLDGDLDILSASAGESHFNWHENDGLGTFGSAQPIGSMVAEPVYVVAADIDGDGDADAVCTSRADNTIRWYPNDGSGHFGNAVIITSVARTASSTAVVDVDGDGDLDVVASSSLDDKVAWHKNTGGGAGWEERVISQDAGSPEQVIASDIDGDGLDDVISTSPNADRIDWYRNTGGGTFGPTQNISSSGSGANRIEAADLDGDGDPDLLVASAQNNAVAWYENDGAGLFGAQRIISSSIAGTRACTAADLDRDGDLDVLSASQTRDTVAWFQRYRTPISGLWTTGVSDSGSPRLAGQAELHWNIAGGSAITSGDPLYANPGPDARWIRPLSGPQPYVYHLDFELTSFVDPQRSFIEIVVGADDCTNSQLAVNGVTVAEDFCFRPDDLEAQRYRITSGLQSGTNTLSVTNFNTGGPTGILVREIHGWSESADCNTNGVPDSEDIASGFSSDCDADGQPDECQIATDTSLDCDGNGILDSCELVDCDNDGVLDACQIAGDPNLDQNVNGILDSCECAIQTYCFAAANSTGQPAAMGGSGTASLSANDLTLSVSSAPPFQFGLFFYGADEDFTIFGDGALCVSGPFARVLPVIATDGTGSASVLLNLYDDPFTVSPNIVAPFETWRFQFWYRDPLGGPSGFNLSNGLAVTFCP